MEALGGLSYAFNATMQIVTRKTSAKNPLPLGRGFFCFISIVQNSIVPIFTIFSDIFGFCYSVYLEWYVQADSVPRQG